MTIIELREKRNKAWEAAKAFVETKRDKDGLLSAEDAASYAEMEQKIKDYGAEIERMEQMAAMDAQLSKPTSTPLTGKPMNGGKPKSGRASDEYRAAMLNALRTNFRQVSDVLSEGVDANGGYLVPEEYDSRLINTLTEENIMRKLGHTITTSGEHKINIAATKPAAAWIDEGGALSFGDATFAQINLDAHKQHVAVKVTEELLYDNAFGLESYIIEQFGKALSNAEEDAFLNGDGVGKPLGIFADKGGGEVAITTASATAITADEVINLVYSLKRPYRKNAKFIMNDQTIAALRKLKDTDTKSVQLPQRAARTPPTMGNMGKPVAIGFRVKKSNGKYRYFWLYRVKFGIPSTSLATKGDSITFSKPTIEGTVLRRNKPDGSGKHPWKAEATEGEKNVPDSVITGWYKSVYEPTFTAKPAETGK